MATAVKILTINSPAFKHEGGIPERYTCEGEDINPPIAIQGIPEETQSLALIVDDPDAPGKTFDHWVVYNIEPDCPIAENTIPGIQGKNGSGENAYMGPCPPAGTHRYFFKVYALDTMLDVGEGADKESIEQAMQGHVLASGELVGLYKKKMR